MCFSFCKNRTYYTAYFKIKLWSFIGVDINVSANQTDFQKITAPEFFRITIID